MQAEVDFCKMRSGNIWREVTRSKFLYECGINWFFLLAQVLSSVHPRVARQAGYDAPVSLGDLET